MTETPLQLRQCRYEKRKQERQIRERTRLSCLSVGSNRCLLLLWWVAKEWRKKYGLHTSRLRNCDQTAISRLFEGSCPIKSPAWIIRGVSCYKKRGRLLWKEPFEGTACLTLLFLVNIRALEVVFPYQQGSMSPSALNAGWERMPLNFPGNLPDRPNEC